MAKEKKRVTLTLNEEEAEDLIRLVFLGSWMSGAYDANPFAIDEDGTAQRIYKTIHDAVKGDKIQYAKELDRYFVGPDLEEELYEEVIHEYNEITFTEKLCEAMVAIEVEKRHGMQNLIKKDPDEGMSEMVKLHKKYQEAIYENYDDLMKHIAGYFGGNVKG